MKGNAKNYSGRDSRNYSRAKEYDERYSSHQLVGSGLILGGFGIAGAGLLVDGVGGLAGRIANNAEVVSVTDALGLSTLMSGLASVAVGTVVYVVPEIKADLRERRLYKKLNRERKSETAYSATKNTG